MRAYNKVQINSGLQFQLAYNCDYSANVKKCMSGSWMWFNSKSMIDLI